MPPGGDSWGGAWGVVESVDPARVMMAATVSIGRWVARCLACIGLPGYGLV